MKVVASDLGRYEREAWVDHVTIAPAERYVVDVRFPTAGDVSLVNRVRAIDHIMARFFEEKHVLGVVHVSPEAAPPRSSGQLRAAAPQRRGVRRDRPVSEAFRAARRSRARRHAGGRRAAVPAAAAAEPRVGLSQPRRVERDDARDGLDRDGPARRDGCCATTAPGARTWTSTGGSASATWSSCVWSTIARALHAMQHPIHIHGQRFLVCR